MNIEQVMTRNVETCRPSDSLSVAARIMWEHDCGCVPVVGPEDGRGRLVGMITDRDVCMAAYIQGRTLSEIDVSSAMATEITRCRATDPIDTALKAMEAQQLRRLPIVDAQGHLVGVLSLTDIAREAARERGRATRDEIDCRIGEVLAAIATPRGPRDIAAPARRRSARQAAR